MSSLYRIKVTEKKDDNSFSVHVKVIHPDAMNIPATPGFALMLLNENAAGSQLRSIVDFETVVNEAWVSKNARGIIKSVSMTKEKNRMPDDAKGNSVHSFSHTPDTWPEAELRICCTHPAWCAHIKKDDVWESTAFNTSQKYYEAEVIIPESSDIDIAIESDSGYDEGFIPVPKLFLVKGVPPAALSDIVYLPCYADFSYSVIEKMNGAESCLFSFNEWLGKPVVWNSYGSVNTGILAEVNKNGSLRLISIKGSSRMENNSDPGDLEWIGRAVYNKSKKNNRRELCASDVVFFGDGAVLSVRKEGERVWMQILNRSRYDDVLKMNIVRALAICAVPLVTWDGFSAVSPLGKALAEEMEQRNIDNAGDLYRLVINRFIRSCRLTSSSETMPNVNSMSNDELINFYSLKSWPLHTLEIEFTDPVWIEHLNENTTFSYQLFVNDKEECNDAEDAEKHIAVFTR